MTALTNQSIKLVPVGKILHQYLQLSKKILSLTSIRYGGAANNVDLSDSVQEDYVTGVHSRRALFSLCLYVPFLINRVKIKMAKNESSMLRTPMGDDCLLIVN